MSLLKAINKMTHKIQECTKDVNKKSEQIDTKYNLEIELLKMFKSKFYKHLNSYVKFSTSLDSIDKKYNPKNRILTSVDDEVVSDSYDPSIYRTLKYIKMYMTRYHINLESLNIICNYTIKLLYLANRVYDSHDLLDEFALDNEYEIMMKHLNKEDR